MGKRTTYPRNQMFLIEKPEIGSFCLLSGDIILPDHFSAKSILFKKRADDLFNEKFPD
jgi:hypothetical protein